MNIWEETYGVLFRRQNCRFAPNSKFVCTLSSNLFAKKHFSLYLCDVVSGCHERAVEEGGDKHEKGGFGISIFIQGRGVSPSVRIKGGGACWLVATEKKPNLSVMKKRVGGWKGPFWTIFYHGWGRGIVKELGTPPLLPFLLLLPHFWFREPSSTPSSSSSLSHRTHTLLSRVHVGKRWLCGFAALSRHEHVPRS